MFAAPELGYAPKIVIREEGAKSNQWYYGNSKKTMFYLKTTDDKYAAVVAKADQFQGPEAGLQTMIYFNPSGSRNLELSDDKIVEPRSHKRPERGEPVKSRMREAEKAAAAARSARQP